MCAHAVRVALKTVKGVSDVDVSLSKGSATIVLAPENAATMQQLQDAITKNGFTTNQSVVIVRGQLTRENGAPLLSVRGTTGRFRLEPETGVSALADSLIGKQVVVQGTAPSGPKGKAGDSIRYRSVTEAK